jgi:GTPase
VSLTKPDLSPAERVQEAVTCLPARLESTLKRWTVRDFHDAYRSGETTPMEVRVAPVFALSSLFF